MLHWGKTYKDIMDVSPLCGKRTYRDLAMTVQLPLCIKLVCSAIQGNICSVLEGMMVEAAPERSKLSFKKNPIIPWGKLHDIMAPTLFS